MKIKGIPVWEQHLEKFVLGGFGIVALGVGAMQVLTAPHDVPLDNKSAGPDEIEAALRARADAVASKLSENAAAPSLVEGEIPAGALDDFRASLDGGVSPRRTLPSTAPALAAAILPSEAAVDAGRFYEPSFAAPRMTGVRQEADTLDDTVMAQYPEIAEIFKGAMDAPGTAKDITWMVPLAQVDLAAWRAEIERSLPGGKPPQLPLPTLWYNNSLWLVDVVFERQERTSPGRSSGDAVWSDPTEVAVLPGYFTFRKEIATADVGLRDEMYRLLAQKDKLLQILQPAFLPTKGETFSPALLLSPKDEAAAADTPELRRLKQQYSRKVVERDRTFAEVKDLGGPCEPKGNEERDRRRNDDDRGNSGGDSRAPGGGGLGGGSGGGLGGGRNTGTRTTEEEEKCLRLTRRWKELSDQAKRLEDDIRRLSPNVDLQGRSGVIDLTKDDALTVWTHDIWVQPGATYRYRCRVELYNPFFARKRQLLPEQQSLSDRFVIASATSPWSEPATVEPPVRFFVTDATESGGRLGLGSAKIELYRFVDGERRTETVHVQPGDRVGMMVERRRDGTAVDFTTDWFVVDIVDDGGDRQRGGHVLLRRADDPTIHVRMPVLDASSDERMRFSDEVQAARDARSQGADRPSEPDAPANDGGGRGLGGGGGFGGPSGG
jgi:hypothetical protein